jgi:hypothetical protein
MAYPENTYPTDPDLPAPSNQVTFDVNLYNVITGYISDISDALSSISDNSGNLDLASGHYIAWVNVAKAMMGYGGVSIDCDGYYYAEALTGIHDVTTQDLCVSAWIRLDWDSTGIEGIIVKRKTISGEGYLFGIDDTTFGGADGVLLLFISDGTDAYTLTGNTDLRDGAWHHVAAIIDRNVAGNCKLYLDGSEDGTTNKAGTLADVGSLTNISKMRLGSGAVAGRIFDGQIADAKVYIASGATWTEDQVEKQYENPYNLVAGLVGNLSGWWFCDDYEGTTVTGSADLTLTSSLAWLENGPTSVVQLDNINVSTLNFTTFETWNSLYLYQDSTTGTLNIGGNLTVSGDISAETISETTIAIDQRATPSNPPDDNAYLWNDDGAGAHDVGDIMVLLTHGEVTKTKKLVDFA